MLLSIYRLLFAKTIEIFLVHLSSFPWRTNFPCPKAGITSFGEQDSLVRKNFVFNFLLCTRAYKTCQERVGRLYGAKGLNADTFHSISSIFHPLRVYYVEKMSAELNVSLVHIPM